MNEIEALKAHWESAYILLLVHIAIATILFSIIVGKKLLKLDIYSSFYQATKYCVYTYILSSLILLIISHPVLNFIFSLKESFDILLLPLYYQWISRVILIPISIISNFLILRLFNLNNVNFKIHNIIGIIIIAEIALLPINIFFMIFYL